MKTELHLPVKSHKKCHPNPCKNDGVCFEKHDGGFGCKCKHEYLPPLCKERDPCKPNPCGQYGECIAIGQSIKCRCDEQYSGRYCNVIDPCKEIGLCANNGECVPTGNNTYGCKCAGRWSGLRCQDCSCPRSIDESIPSSQCDVNGACKCPEGYIFNVVTGQCLAEQKFPMPEVFGKSCRTNPCENGGQCIEEIGVAEESYKCICPEGTYGKNCIYKNKCMPNPCLNGGSCLELDGRFLGCKCADGYHTPLCRKETIPTTACKPSPCQNGASCIPHPNGGYDCICKVRFTGPHCTIDRCRDCDENARCEQGKCVCNDNYIGNGYECVKKTCPAPCLQFQTCIDSKCQCIPGHRQVSNICIPITDFTNSNYADPLPSDQVRPVITSVAQIHPSTKPLKPTTRPNIKPVAPTEKANHTAATTSSATLTPTKSLFANTATTAATAATTVAPPPSTTPVLTTTTVASGNLSSQGTVFNKTMFSTDIKNATINLSNNTNSFPKNISSTNSANVKESTNTSSAVETPIEKVIKIKTESDDKNNVNNTTSNDGEKKKPVLDVLESKSQSILANSTDGETKLPVKQATSPMTLAELKLGLTRLAAPVEQEKASISDGISGLDSTPPSKSIHHFSNSSLDAKPKKKKTKAEKYFEAKMRILSSYLRTHGKAKLNKVLDDIISQKRNHGKNKHASKKNDTKKPRKDESLIIHVHTGATSDLADLNAVLKRFTHNHNLASLTPDDIERMLEQHQAKIDQQAKKKQVKHTENTPMSVNVKINSNNVKEISGVMKHEISVQGHDGSEKTQTVQVDQEGSAEEQDEERLAPQDSREQQPGLEQAQEEMNEDITTDNTVDDSGLQAEDALQTEDALQNSFVSGSKKYQRPKQTGDVARNEETSNGFNKLTAEELAYYFNKNDNKNNADDIERKMAAEKKNKEDIGIEKLFQTISNGEESTTQLSALSHSPSAIDASSVTHPKNQTFQRIVNSSADTGFLHQFFNNYNSDITTNGEKTDEFEDDDDATLQQLKEERKDKTVSLTKQQQNLEVQTLKDAVEHHNQLNQQLRNKEIENIEEEETNNEKLLEELKNKNMAKEDGNRMNHSVIQEKITEVELKEKRLKVLEEEKMKALKTLKEAQEKHNQMLREEELKKQDEKLKEESIRYLKEEKTKALKKLKEEQHQSDNVFKDDDEKDKEKEKDDVRVQNQREDQQKQALKKLLEAQQRHKQEEIESEKKFEAEEIEKKYKEKYEKEKKIAFMKLQEEQKLEREKEKDREEKERKEKENRRQRKKEQEQKRKKEKEEILKQEKEKERKIKKLQEEKLQAIKVLTKARLREQKMRQQEKEQKKLEEKRLQRIRFLHEQKEKESKAFEEAKLKEKEKIRQEEEERQKMNIKILKEEREKSLQALRDAKLRQRNKTLADVRREQYEKEKEENKEMLEEQRAEALTVLKKTRERQESLRLKEEERQKEIQKSLEEQKRLVLRKQQEKKKKERTEEEKRRDEERKTENLEILHQLKKKEMEVLNEKEKGRRAMEKQNATRQRLKEFQMAEKIKMAAHNDASTNRNSDKQEQDKMIAEIKEESMKVLREENKENRKEILKKQREALMNMTQARTNKLKGRKTPLKTTIKAEVDEDEDEGTSMEEQKLKNENMIEELKQEAKSKDWKNLVLTKKTSNANKSMEKNEVEGSYQSSTGENNAGEEKRKELQEFVLEPQNKFHGKQFKFLNALTLNKITEKTSHPIGMQENFKEENKPEGEVHFPPMKDKFLRSKPMGSNVEKPTQIDTNLFEELKQQALNTLHERQKQWEEALEAKTKDEEQRGNKENVDLDKDVSIEEMQQNNDFSRNKLAEKSKNVVNGKDSRLNKNKKWNEILNSQAKDDKQNEKKEDLSNDISNTKVEQSTEGHLNGEIEEKINEHDVDVNIKTLGQEKLKGKLRNKNDYSGISKFENTKLEGTKMITGKGENTKLGGQKAQRVMPVISKVESLMIEKPKVVNVMDQIRKEQIKEIQEKERKLQEKYLREEKEQKVQQIHQRQKLLDAKLLEKIKQQQYNALQEHLQKAKKEAELKKFLDENADTEGSGSGEENEKHNSNTNTPANSELLKALSALSKFKNESDESSSIERAVTPNKREHARSSNKFQTYVASLLQHRQQGIIHDIAFRRSKEITYDEDRPHGLTFKRSETASFKHRNRTRSKRDN